MYKQALIEVPSPIDFRNELRTQFPEFFDQDENGDPYDVPNYRFNYYNCETEDGATGIYHIIVSDTDWGILTTGTWTTCTILCNVQKGENILSALIARPTKLLRYVARVYNHLLDDEGLQNPKAYAFMIRNIDTYEIRKFWEDGDVLAGDEEKIANPVYEAVRNCGDWA